MHKSLAEWLLQEEAFLLIAHVSPDGDTIGSCLALYGMLTALGKGASICCDQPVPKIYRFLPWADKIVLTEEAGAYTNVIAVDCADPARMGYAEALFQKAGARGNIDHHRTNDAFGEYVRHDASASATGELVYALWRELGQPGDEAMARDIAACLFTAICTDTGSFAYNNTTPATFRIAAELLELGIDITAINREVYRTVSYPRTLLKGQVLSSIELYDEGRVGFAQLSAADLLRFHTTGEDVEGMIDHVRDVDTVEIAILMREASDGSLKASFRSKRYADVSALAGRFGGGGHLRASGCTLRGNAEEMKRRLINAAVEALEAYA